MLIFGGAYIRRFTVALKMKIHLCLQVYSRPSSCVQISWALLITCYIKEHQFEAAGFAIVGLP